MSDSGASPGLDGCRQRGSASFGQRPGQGYLESAVRPDSTRDRLSLKDISSSLCHQVPKGRCFPLFATL